MEWISTNVSSTLDSSLILSYIIVYAGGVLTSFTPCVYPMVPITVGIIGAMTERSRLRGFLLSVFYVLGIAVTYTVLGVFAAMTGRLFGVISTNPWVLLVVANVILLFGLAMLDVYEIPIPGFLRGVRTTGHTGGFASVLLLGLVSGFIAAPCTAPVLGVLLAYVATNQSPVIGGSLLFVFAFGMGTLLILVGTFTSVLVSLPKSGKWMVMVKKVMGFLLILIGEYFLVQAGRYIL